MKCRFAWLLGALFAQLFLCWSWRCVCVCVCVTVGCLPPSNTECIMIRYRVSSEPVWIYRWPHLFFSLSLACTASHQLWEEEKNQMSTNCPSSLTLLFHAPRRHAHTPDGRDGSGKLSIEEFMALPDLGQNPLVERVIAIFDTDGDGEIDFEGGCNHQRCPAVLCSPPLPVDTVMDGT